MIECKDGLPHLESKIENMVDELIKIDEEIENNDMNNSLKSNDDIFSSKEEKEEKLFKKDFFNNSNIENEDKINLNNYIITPILSQNNKNSKLFCQINNNQIIFNNNIINNNFSPFIYKDSSIPTFNKINYKNQPILGIKIHNMINNMNNKNNNININNYINFTPNNIPNSYKTLNSTNSFFTKNCKKSEEIFENNSNESYSFPIKKKRNNNLINYKYGNFNNSFYKRNKISNFNKNKENHYSYYMEDKICSNRKFINSKHNIKSSPLNINDELEILLIEVNKILSKIEKIDQFCYNKLKGKFEQIIRTHKGSRIFQNYLKNTHNDILHLIFLELKSKLSHLLKDNYANYFCKKFFDNLDQKDRIEYLLLIQNDLNHLAIDLTATYPIQGIIENLGSKNEKKIVYLGIKNSINIFCYNVYGTHILEKMLSYFEDEFIKEIMDFVYINFIELAYHVNGICIVKKLLLMTHKKDLHQKLKKKVIENAFNLIVHQYGNYVIQVIVENWDDNELEDIINLYKNKYVYLSKQKFSSNVIERIIEKNKINLEFYINKICLDNNLYQIMKNNYGNYVIQKALKLSSGDIKEKLINNIIKIIDKLEDKKIINRWKMIISSSKSLF